MDNIPMNEKYIAELAGRDPSTVDALFLDNSTGGVIAGIDDKLTSLASLSMVNCNLTSFRGLPKLPALKHLDVTSNKFEGSPDFEALVESVPGLERLDLSHNNIPSVDVLLPLKSLEFLEELSITQNPNIPLRADYRDKIFEMIPSLTCLDGCDPNGDNFEDDFDSGEDSESGDDDDDDEDGPGLSYLDRSQFSDDETDDYQPADEPVNNKRRADQPASSSGAPVTKKSAQS